MSDQNAPKGKGAVKSYLGFIDNNVLFKKPISCLHAIVSLLLPIFFLIQLIQFGVFESGEANIIIAGILLLAVVAFAGIFGAAIWWHRRIVRDEGTKVYDNFRRFVQTAGEWTGTVIAIVFFGGVIILMLLLNEDYHMMTGFISMPFPMLDFAFAFYGPIAGFLIIILTKILLFLLDPIIWLVKQIWALFVRVVLFFYRNVLNLGSIAEKNTPVWVGVTWLLAVISVIASLGLCYLYSGLFPVIALFGSLGFLGYVLYKRKMDA